MIRYLPDTNVFIATMTRANPVVDDRMVAHRSEMGLSSVVLFELYFGAFNSARIQHNLDRIARIGLPMLDLSADDARAAGQVRATLKRAGTPIGQYDLLIAGQAIARDLTLVTNNTREFARVEGLKLADWTL